jgi:hypothetical protein
MTKPKTVSTTTRVNPLPSTGSTVQIYSTLRKAILDYVSPQGERLKTIVGQPERVYVRAAPTNVVFPYLTLLLNRTSLTAYNGYRETAVLEVQAIGKPESQLPLVESAMDLVDQCLTGYVYNTDGVMVGRSRTRNTVPLLTDPAESPIVCVIASYELYLWPSVLTSRRA